MAGSRGVVVLLRTLLLIRRVSEMVGTGLGGWPLPQNWQHRTDVRNRMCGEGPRWRSGP